MTETERKLKIAGKAKMCCIKYADRKMIFCRKCGKDIYYLWNE